MYVSIDVPEISQFTKGFLSYWMKTIFVGDVSASTKVRALASTYVRLVEAALTEYRLGTEKLREFWDDHSVVNLTAANRSVSHFESCLSDIYRATNCYRRLRKIKDPLSAVLNENKPSFATDPIFDQIRSMRHEIHHLEELVLDGRLQDGQPIALKPDGPETPHPTEANQTNKSIDRLVIAGRELLFSSLAAWLTEMGNEAERIGNFAPNQVLADSART